jgi:hypothetical protein
MTPDLEHIQIFLASPSDLTDERQTFVKVVEEVNRTVAVPSGMYLEVVSWETHVRPGMAADAQGVVNEQIRPRDLFVGLMWRRYGTPSSRADSGTQEEFEAAYDLWRRDGKPRVMLYFKTQPFYMSTVEENAQYAKVLDFRQRVQTLGALVSEFQSLDDFRDLARQHLVMEVTERRREHTRSGGPVADPGALASLPRRPADDVASAGDSTAEPDPLLGLSRVWLGKYNADLEYLRACHTIDMVAINFAGFNDFAPHVRDAVLRQNAQVRVLLLEPEGEAFRVYVGKASEHDAPGLRESSAHAVQYLLKIDRESARQARERGGTGGSAAASGTNTLTRFRTAAALSRKRLSGTGHIWSTCTRRTPPPTR